MIFEAVNLEGQLAQLVRAFGSHPKGHWFKSSIAHHEVKGGRVTKRYCHVSRRSEKEIWMSDQYAGMQIKNVKSARQAVDRHFFYGVIL